MELTIIRSQFDDITSLDEVHLEVLGRAASLLKDAIVREANLFYPSPHDSRVDRTDPARHVRTMAAYLGALRALEPTSDRLWPFDV